MINKRQVKFGGNYVSLYDYAKKKWVKTVPFTNDGIVVANADVVLIDGAVVAGTLAIGSNTTAPSLSYVAAGIPAVGLGTGATTTLVDSLGNIANLVSIRNATTHDPVVYGDREVFGLVQADNASDNQPINPVATANMQVSFVTISADGTLALATVNETIEIAYKKLIIEEDAPVYEVVSGGIAPDVVSPTQASLRKAQYTVNSAFPVSEVIDLTDGTGTVDGTTVIYGADTTNIDLGADAATFRANNKIKFLLNGVELVKETEVVYDTLNTVHFTVALDVDDVFTIEWYSM